VENLADATDARPATLEDTSLQPRRPRVVIVGGGFGGMSAAKALKRAPVDVTVIDRENYHLFQPLMYQVAMAELSTNDVTASIRAVLAPNKNTTVLLGEVRALDLERRTVSTQNETIAYDYLVVAAGAQPNYFGRDHWEQIAPSPKSLDAAYVIRRRVLLAFEEAESLKNDSPLRRRLLEFVVIGGGATGVEFAGALAELARRGLANEFRRIDSREARVHLVEGGPRILSTFPPHLSDKAAKDLDALGVQVRTNVRVVELDEGGVTLSDGDRVDCATVIWAAGVKPTLMSALLPGERDRQGRVSVGPDLSIPAHPEIFVIGDMAHFVQDGQALAGLGPVAIQGGRAAARAIVRSINGQPREPFRYFDKGMLATTGKMRAVGVVRRFHFSGPFAWLTWAFVHIYFLIGFRSRVLVAGEWLWNYLTGRHAARTIHGLAHPLACVRDRHPNGARDVGDVA
jgi:NADH:ubiquinone reductase (H+-translocating)